MSEDRSKEAEAAHVTIFRTYDAVNAEMLVEMLQNNGYAARLLGTTHGPLIGVPQLAFEVHIEVPASQAQAAEEFVIAFTAPHPLTDEEAAAAEAAESARSPSGDQ